MYKNSSSRKIDSPRLFSRENDFLKTFSLGENQFSRKTYFYTIASRVGTSRGLPRRRRRRRGTMGTMDITGITREPIRPTRTPPATRRAAIRPRHHLRVCLLQLTGMEKFSSIDHQSPLPSPPVLLYERTWHPVQVLSTGPYYAWVPKIGPPVRYRS